MGNLVMYLRLSIEDDAMKDESNSITNQRRLLREYIKNHEDLRGMTVMEKSDDGYSGTNLNRPGVQELLDMVKENRVDVIIVKDISRFSRNYLDSGKYLEQIFPFMGVRFISVNDNYDSKDFVGGLGDIDVQFKSLLYDFVSKETSDKVRAGYEIKKAEGVYYSRCAPYGYVIDETLPTRIRVDEEAAEIIRYIFKLRREGLSTNKIAKALNGAGVKVPSVYLNEKFGVGKFHAKGKQLKWSSAGVSHILSNEIYAGTFVYGKYRTEVVGSRKPRLLPKSEWKRIPNHHEPVVSMEEFLPVQDENATFFGNNVTVDREKPLFGGIVICGQCGCNLQYAYSAKGRDTYRCKNRYVGGENTCESYLFADNLEEVVKGQLSVYLSKIKDMSALLGRKQENLSKRHKTATTHLYQMEDTKRRLQTDLRDAYEAYVMKVTDKETYLEQRELYEGMLVSLEEKLELQKEAISVLEEEMSASDNVEGLHIDTDSISLEKLNRKLVETLVDKIIVHGKDTVEIRWKFRVDA